MKLPLAKDKKLEVIFRLEPGCLGPEGKDRVSDFCVFAQNKLDGMESNFVHWNIIPRHDKSLPELEYKLSNKKLTHDKAEKYLQLFNKNLDEFESRLQNELALHIDEYLDQKF